MQTKPIVGIITSESSAFSGRQKLHSVGQRYVNAAMQFADVIPTLIPTCLSKKDLKDYITQIDGVLLTGGRANIEPHHFGGKKFPKDEIIDPARDYTALNLIRECSRLRIPIFGICRGIQEINVAYGGTLIYRVHERSDKKDHRMPQNDDASLEEIFKPRHIIVVNLNYTFFISNTIFGGSPWLLNKNLVLRDKSCFELLESFYILGLIKRTIIYCLI